jgi:hypothetical protein
LILVIPKPTEWWIISLRSWDGIRKHFALSDFDRFRSDRISGNPLLTAGMVVGQMAAKLRAGTVWINCYNVFDPALPFGGYKQSGWGREMGYAGLELYTETKAVCAQL